MNKEEKSTYQMVYFCLNCKEKKWKRFPFGESAGNIDDEDACEYCGCSYFSNAFHPDSKKAKELNG